MESIRVHLLCGQTGDVLTRLGPLAVSANEPFEVQKQVIAVFLGKRVDEFRLAREVQGRMQLIDRLDVTPGGGEIEIFVFLVECDFRLPDFLSFDGGGDTYPSSLLLGDESIPSFDDDFGLCDGVSRPYDTPPSTPVRFIPPESLIESRPPLPPSPPTAPPVVVHPRPVPVPTARELFDLLQEDGVVLEIVNGGVRENARNGNYTWITLDIDTFKPLNSSCATFKVPNGPTFKASSSKFPSDTNGVLKVKLQKSNNDWSRFSTTDTKDEPGSRVKKSAAKKLGKENKTRPRDGGGSCRDQFGHDKNNKDDNDDDDIGPGPKKREKSEQYVSMMSNLASRSEALFFGCNASQLDKENFIEHAQKVTEGDVAYWTRKLYNDESMRPGEVVALLFADDGGLRATKSPSTENKVFAWSVIANREDVSECRSSILVGNPSELDVLVVYMGHVKLWVDGEVSSGDALFASGSGKAAREPLNSGRVGVALSNRQEDGCVAAFVWLLQGGELSQLPKDVKDFSVHIHGQEDAITLSAERLAELVRESDEANFYDEDCQDAESKRLSDGWSLQSPSLGMDYFFEGSESVELTKLDKRLEVRGFKDDEGMQEFIRLFFGEFEAGLTGAEPVINDARVREVLQKSPLLREACKVPLMLTLICSIAPKLNSSISLTQIYELAVESKLECYAKESNKDKSKLHEALKLFAWESFKENKKHVSLPKLVGDNAVYVWTHRTIQEYLAAEYLLRSGKEEEIILNLKELLSRENSGIFFGFVCGFGRDQPKEWWTKWFPSVDLRTLERPYDLKQPDPATVWLRDDQRSHVWTSAIAWIEEGGSNLKSALREIWRDALERNPNNLLLRAVALGSVVATEFFLEFVKIDHAAIETGRDDVYLLNQFDPSKHGLDQEEFSSQSDSGNVAIATNMVEGGGDGRPIDLNALPIVETKFVPPSTSTDFHPTFKIPKADIVVERWTPVTLAAKLGHAEVLNCLLSRGADVDEHCQTGLGQSALALAIHGGHVEIVKALLKKNAKADHSDLVDAIHSGNLAVVRCLLENSKLDIDFHYDEEWPALMLAVNSVRFDIVNCLLDFKADANVIDDFCMTPLMVAAENNSLKIVELLVEHGADITAKDEDGWTAMMFASLRNRLEIVQYLLKNGADVNASGKAGKTALMLAAANGHLAIVKLLLENGADVSAVDQDRMTAMSFGIDYDKQEVVALLEKYSVEVRKATSQEE
jgi:ankyrin repeat protein